MEYQLQNADVTIDQLLSELKTVEVTPRWLESNTIKIGVVACYWESLMKFEEQGREYPEISEKVRSIFSKIDPLFIKESQKGEDADLLMSYALRAARKLSDSFGKRTVYGLYSAQTLLNEIRLYFSNKVANPFLDNAATPSMIMNQLKNIADNLEFAILRAHTTDPVYFEPQIRRIKDEYDEILELKLRYDDIQGTPVTAS